MATCDPQTLITDGKCFSLSCLTPDQQRIARLQLLCEIKDALSGGGGGGVTSIIAGSGISVDQATGDVTVTATGGGSPVDIYWFDGNTFGNSTINIDLVAATPWTDITPVLTGWSGAVTAALLAAIVAGKKIEFAIYAETNLTNSGVLTMFGNAEIALGGSGAGDGTNFPPRVYGNVGTNVNAISDASAAYAISQQTDFTTSNSVLIGQSGSSVNASGTANFTNLGNSPAQKVDAGFLAIFDGKIYINPNLTNTSVATLTIYSFRVTILNP